MTMETVLSKEIQAGLDAARMRSLPQASRLRVSVGDAVYPVMRMDKAGFVVSAQDAPNLRGLLDVYDGAQHLFHCLVVASEESDGEVTFAFKRATPVATQAALDFERSASAPYGYIPKH
jgi:hypothetical protein